MTKLSWNTTGTRTYEHGVDRGVFYPKDGPGVPWNGLTAVNETPSDSILKRVYLDGVAVRQSFGTTEFDATVSAIFYPLVVEQYEGLYGRPLSAIPFDFSYRTFEASDTNPETARKIHLVYNARITPVQRAMSTLNNGVNYSTFDWNMSTIPLRVPGALHTAHIILDEIDFDSRLLPILEDVLYGTDKTPARMPSPQEIADIMGYDLLYILPQTNGLAKLVQNVSWDLQGDVKVGLYKKSYVSRLTETSTPGLFTLE